MPDNAATICAPGKVRKLALEVRAVSCVDIETRTEVWYEKCDCEIKEASIRCCQVIVCDGAGNLDKQRSFLKCEKSGSVSSVFPTKGFSKPTEDPCDALRNVPIVSSN